MGAYTVAVVGESFDNDDGSSRQAEIARCRRGEPARLERQADNPYDQNCVRVISARGVQIGNIGRDDRWIAERIDRGAFVEARIRSVNRGRNGLAGAVLLVRTGSKDNWDQLADDQEAWPSGGCAGMLAGLLLLGGLALLAESTAAEPTRVARDIDRFCSGSPTCVGRQRAALRYFLNLSVVSGVSEADVERCMRSGKRGKKTIDWTVAEACLRGVAKDRKAIAPFFEERG